MTPDGSRQHLVTSIEALESVYGAPSGPAVVKELDHVNAHYRAFIEAALSARWRRADPMASMHALSRSARALVRVRNEKTLLIPDRTKAANNRIEAIGPLVAIAQKGAASMKAR